MMITRTMASTVLSVAVAAAMLSGCNATQNAERTSEAPAKASAREFVALFEHVRADVHGRLVEFDAEVSPILVKDDRAPLLYLEVLTCIPGTREHETLVVSSAKASHVHAALLAVGAKAGTPGGFEWTEKTLRPIEASGSRVDVRFVYDDNGQEREIDPLEWVVNAGDGRGFRSFEAGRDVGFVFAGSRIVKVAGTERYAGDLGGNIVGLTTFGDEVIGLSKTISPEAAVQAPEWVAKLDAIPPAGTAIKVRVRVLDGEQLVK